MPRRATDPLEWLSPLPGLQPSPWNPHSRLLAHQGLAEMHLLNEPFLATLSKTETPSPTPLVFFILSYVLIVFIFRAVLVECSKMESTEFPYTPCPHTRTTTPIVNIPQQVVHLLELPSLCGHLIIAKIHGSCYGSLLVLCVLWVWRNV